MFKELETFSHIWLQFMFHEAVSDGWRPTVRPPWLGGQRRVGLFASRSPHRPNFLGLSVVRYLGLRKEKGKVFLDISELDLLHGTPIVDIKPYIPYSDRVEGASGGFVQISNNRITVSFTPEAEASCQQYQEQSGRELKSLIQEILEHDPRPASQRSQQREYGMLLWDRNVRWLAEESGFTVLSVMETKSR